VDFTTVWLLDDGDSWPNGCGDMIFEFMITAKAAGTGEQQQWEKKRTAGETCLDSGAWYSVGAQAGHFHRDNYQLASMSVGMYVSDMDIGQVGVFCGNQDWENPACGDVASKFSSVDIKPGVTNFCWHVWTTGGTDAYVWF